MPPCTLFASLRRPMSSSIELMLVHMCLPWRYRNEWSSSGVILLILLQTWPNGLWFKIITQCYSWLPGWVFKTCLLKYRVMGNLSSAEQATVSSLQLMSELIQILLGKDWKDLWQPGSLLSWVILRMWLSRNFSWRYDFVACNLLTTRLRHFLGHVLKPYNFFRVVRRFRQRQSRSV